jgi:predicted DNA-binding ribbon-helix-helix protein
VRHQPVHLEPAVWPATADGPLARLFGLCNPEQARSFAPEKRSVRIHGHSTTIRLEQAFWTVLDEMAREEGVTASALIARIHDHCLVTNDKNLASCLRVVCLKYINLGH